MVLYHMEFGMSILKSEFIENLFEIVVNFYYFNLQRIIFVKALVKLIFKCPI